jgi:hypothetical protein
MRAPITPALHWALDPFVKPAARQLFKGEVIVCSTAFNSRSWALPQRCLMGSHEWHVSAGRDRRARTRRLTTREARQTFPVALLPCHPSSSVGGSTNSREALSKYNDSERAHFPKREYSPADDWPGPTFYLEQASSNHRRGPSWPEFADGQVARCYATSEPLLRDLAVPKPGV